MILEGNQKVSQEVMPSVSSNMNDRDCGGEDLSVLLRIIEAVLQGIGKNSSSGSMGTPFEENS